MRWLTHAQVERLLAELSAHQQDLMLFALATGLRQGNIKRLTWDQVDLARRIVTIEHGDTKNGEALGVPLNDLAVSVLERQMPAYVRATKRATGESAYYWELPPWARPTRDADGKLQPAVRDGRRCALVSTALGTDLAAAITKGDALNEALAQWRTGRGIVLTKGTVEWVFDWYRDQERFKKNTAKTRSDYRKLMDMLAAFEPKAGAAPLGKRMANKVDASVADKLYQKLRERGERQATYAMQVCRLV